MVKKKAVLHVCAHCQKEFGIPVRWCASCSDHTGPRGWSKDGNDACARCVSGENAEYIKRVAGRGERVAKMLEEAADQSRWCRCGIQEAHKAWVSSPEFLNRFAWPPPDFVLKRMAEIANMAVSGKASCPMHKGTDLVNHAGSDVEIFDDKDIFGDFCL